MNCDRTQEISRLIDGEMAPAEAQSVEQHLAQCSDCSQAREDFFTFRSQITKYQSLVDPTATRQALAKVMSSEGTTTSDRQTTRRSSRQYLPAFAFLRFNPAFVTALALLLTGSIAFVIYRAQQESGSGAPQSQVAQTSAANSPAPSPSNQVADGSSSASGSEDLIAENSNRKPRKGGSRDTGTIKRKSSSPLRPPRERDPKPTQVRSAAPPTFARLNERVLPGAGELGMVADLGNGNLRHLEQSELLLRAFRNIRSGKKGGGPDVSYERRRAQQLVYQNMLLRREADATGNIEVATLLGSLEPILLDIANLRPRPRNEEVTVIRERVERQSLVPLLQVSAMAVMRPDE